VPGKRSPRERPPQERPARERPASSLWLPGTWLLAWIVLLVRPTGTRTWQALWAEDGTVFLNGALWHSAPGIWFQPYQGYLHLVPRLVATAATAVPLDRAPVVFALASTAVAAACVVLLAWALRRWLQPAWMRAAFVVCLVLVDGAAQEIDGNSANLHWFLGLGMLGLALARPTRMLTTLLAALVALVFALSEILGVFALLVAVAVAFARSRGAGDRGGVRPGTVRVWLLPTALAAGLLTQVVLGRLAPRGRPAGSVPGADTIGSWYLHHVVGHGVAPSFTGHLTLAALAALLAVVVLAVTVLLLLARRQGMPVGSRVLVGATLLWLSAAYFTSSVVVNRALADRYLDLPAVLLVAGILVLIAGSLPWQRVVFLVAVLALAAAETFSFTTYPRITQSESWASALQASTAAQCHGRATTALVGIAPTSRQDPLRAHWTVTVPCPPESLSVNPRIPAARRSGGVEGRAPGTGR
jgi:hypothetical protein